MKSIFFLALEATAFRTLRSPARDVDLPLRRLAPTGVHTQRLQPQKDGEYRRLAIPAGPAAINKVAHANPRHKPRPPAAREHVNVIAPQRAEKAQSVVLREEEALRQAQHFLGPDDLKKLRMTGRPADRIVTTHLDRTVAPHLERHRAHNSTPEELVAETMRLRASTARPTDRARAHEDLKRSVTLSETEAIKDELLLDNLRHKLDASAAGNLIWADYRLRDRNWADMRLRLARDAERIESGVVYRETDFRSSAVNLGFHDSASPAFITPQERSSAFMKKAAPPHPAASRPVRHHSVSETPSALRVPYIPKNAARNADNGGQHGIVARLSQQNAARAELSQLRAEALHKRNGEVARELVDRAAKLWPQ